MGVFVAAIAVSLLLFIAYQFVRGVKKELEINTLTVPQQISQWAPEVREYSNRYNVPFKTALSVLAIESGGRPDAVGSAGEIGLMQLKRIAVADVRENLDEEINLQEYQFNPAENIRAGIAFLKLQHKRTNDWDEAIKAYNQGYQGKDIFVDAANQYLTKVKRFRSTL